MKIMITGAAGFIGSNLIRTINKLYPEYKIVAVDDITEDKFKNVNDLVVYEWLAIKDIFYPDVDAVIHLGANSNTNATWKECYENNLCFSKILYHHTNTKFIYASSAGVYGHNKINIEEHQYEKPITFYGWSKKSFDDYVRFNWPIQNETFKPTPKPTRVYGLRLFNVYGRGESHKFGQCSPFYTFGQNMRRYLKTNVHQECAIFSGVDSLGNYFLEHKRDFVYIDDVVDVILHFLHENRIKSGIYNVGTGECHTFKDVFYAMKKANNINDYNVFVREGPKDRQFQSYTKADLTKLREVAGYKKEFLSIEKGAELYAEWFNEQ